jgi:hypothetical protein
MKTKEQEYIETMTYAPCNRTRTIEKSNTNQQQRINPNTNNKTQNEEQGTNNHEQTIKNK